MDFTISMDLLILVVLLVGLAGFIDAAAGGGGLISLPAYLFVGLPVHFAYGTNKFTSSSGTIFATARYFKGGVVELKMAIIAAIGSFLGSFTGSQIVLLISEATLKKMLLVILPTVAVLIIFKKSGSDENREPEAITTKRMFLAFIIGVLIGAYDALFGPGTGTIALVAFNLILGYDLRYANGNAKVLNLSSNIASLITYWSAGLVCFQVAIPCAIANIIGAFIGSKLVIKNGAKFVRPMMTVVIVLLIGKTVLDFI